MNICGYPVIIKIKVRPEEFHNGITLEELENLLKSGETGKKSKLCQQNAFLKEILRLSKQYKATVQSVSCNKGELVLCFTIDDPDNGHRFAVDASSAANKG